ncbi:MAG: type 4a pilus biogenesis protein PilO [Rubrobacter sp.]
MERNERNLVLLGGLGILLLVVGFYFLLLGPLVGRLDEADQQRDERKARLAQLQQDVAELEEVRRNSPEIERQLLELSKRVPTQPEIPTLTVQIEEIARASGVTQVSLTPGTPTPPPGGGDFTVQPITMSFEGTYEELQDFLGRTDELVRLVTVNGVTYQALAEGTTAQPEIEQLLLVEVEAEAYFQSTGVPSGEAPEAPAPPETTTERSPERDEATDAP